MLKFVMQCLYHLTVEQRTDRARASVPLGETDTNKLREVKDGIKRDNEPFAKELVWSANC